MCTRTLRTLHVYYFLFFQFLIDNSSAECLKHCLKHHFSRLDQLPLRLCLSSRKIVLLVRSSVVLPHEGRVVPSSRVHDARDLRLSVQHAARRVAHHRQYQIHVRHGHLRQTALQVGAASLSSSVAVQLTQISAHCIVVDKAEYVIAQLGLPRRILRHFGAALVVRLGNPPVPVRLNVCLERGGSVILRWQLVKLK